MNEDFKLLDELMKELEGKDKILEHQTRLLFRLNNHIFPDLKEHNMGCAACRGRIYNRMKDYWMNNKK